MPFNFRIERLTVLVIVLWLSTWTSARTLGRQGHQRLHRNDRIHQQQLPSSSASQSDAPYASTAPSRPSIVYPANAAHVTSIFVPSIRSNASQQHLSSTTPDMNYLPDQSAPQVWLPLSMQSLNTPVNALTTDFGMSPASGSLLINSSNAKDLQPLKCSPSISRDGGKGGYLDGHKLFIFADTSTSSSYSPVEGGFAGFVSTSAAVDSGNQGIAGNGLQLMDGCGQWASNFGEKRSFIPMTSSEEAFTSQNNASMRYAIWPDSSIIPYDGKSAFLFAPIVFLDHENETYAGSTLISVSVPGMGGPVTERIAPKLFEENEPQWGVYGGVRSYGPAGPESSEGKVYVYATSDTGLLLARTDAMTISNRDSYEYYHGDGVFNSTMPNTTSSATFVQGSFTALDIFYSPRHLTYICVYQDAGFDSTIFWKYLKADKPILPIYAGGSESDIAENLYRYEWIDQGVLYQPKQPSGGRAYNGGMHAGYFDQDDITNGGTKMLIAWIGPTGGAMDSAGAGYQHFTTSIEFD